MTQAIILLSLIANLLSVGVHANPVLAQLFGSRANATGNLQRVGMDDGTITQFQLMRLAYLSAGQSRTAIRVWANWRSPNQIAFTTRYPAYASDRVDVYRLENQPGTCVALQFNAQIYQGFNFRRCPE